MDRVPSLEESKMLERLKTNRTKVNRSYTDTSADWPIWCMLRDYLESPLGSDLLDEVNASRRDCLVGH